MDTERVCKRYPKLQACCGNQNYYSPNHGWLSKPGMIWVPARFLIYKREIYLPISIKMKKWIDICIYICVSIYMYIYIHTYIYIYTYVYIYTHILYIYIYYIYTYIIYIYVYIYKYIYRQNILLYVQIYIGKIFFYYVRLRSWPFLLAHASCWPWKPVLQRRIAADATLCRKLLCSFALMSKLSGEWSPHYQ